MSPATLPAWDCHTHVFDDAARRPLAPGSHYTPPVRTWQDMSAVGAPHGIERFVLIQPSVYAMDNSLLLDTLDESKGRARGVLVLPDATTETEFLAWRERGARGVRFNAVSGSGNGIAGYARLAPRLRDAGWHAQFFVAPETLSQVYDAVRAEGGPNVVVDHLGGAADGPEYAAIREAVFRLLDTGRVWLKASGFYRYGYPVATWRAHFGDLLRELARRYPERIVWASDWPHTWFFDPAHGRPMPYGDLVALLRDSVGDADFQRILRENPLALYD
ncbi:Amidohydrolase-related domain-containing protein [Bordetella sputigena]|uniref:amidohydrolase family protein n=1 Tax=Bordetella sputigena TaxID=1416810 RepID=UPI0039EDEF6D